MAKPRVFISSTYYDLKHIRNSIQAFIESMGYDAVLFEEGDIAFHHDSPLDVSCYEEIKNCHILVLIIGGRYGAKSSDNAECDDEIEFYNSVTRKEYETALKSDLPIYVFVEKNVHSEYHTFKKNRKNDRVQYAHVDNVNIFRLIDDIYSQKRNNLIKDFEKFDDISNWLRDQWAGLFADMLKRKNSDQNLKDLSTQVSGLQDISSVLKEYTETIMEKLQPENFENIISSSNKRLRDKQISRFSKEPMIEYLLENKTPKGIGIVKIYDALEKSNDLQEFLETIRIEKEELKDLINNSPAPGDYIELKKEYFSD